MGCTLCAHDVQREDFGEVNAAHPAGPHDDAASCPACVTGRRQRAIDETREDRLRRIARRQGLQLITNGRSDHVTASYGLYWSHSAAAHHWPGAHHLLVSPDAGMTLDGIEEYLTYGVTRAEIMEYLVRSYGLSFVDELIKRLPQLRAHLVNPRNF